MTSRIEPGPEFVEPALGVSWNERYTLSFSDLLLFLFKRYMNVAQKFESNTLLGFANWLPKRNQKSTMEAVNFFINGKLLSFEGQEEECISLVTDDEFAIDYITRSVHAGSLQDLGITEDNLNQVEIVRAEEQPNAPEALKKSKSKPNPVIEDENAKGRVWLPHKKASARDNEATHLLLKIRSRPNNMKMFGDKKHNKHGLWLNTAKELREAGYDIDDNLKISAEKCRQKFANLQKCYVAFLDNIKQTGSEYRQKPPFFNEMHFILGDKDKATPRFLVDSLETEPMSTSSIELLSQTENEEAGSSTESNSEYNTSEQTSTKEKSIPNKPNRFSAAKQSLKIPNTKTLIIDEIKLMNEKNLNELKNITTVIKTNMERQNALLENQCQQRQQLIDILKILCKENCKKRSKRKRSSTSSD